MKARIVFSYLLLLILFLSGCKTNDTLKATETLQPDEIKQTIPEDNNAYPVDTTQQELETAYPIDNNNYDQSTVKEGPEFEMFKPVKDGDTVIEGKGPVGVPILLIDITEMGTQLGETLIDNEGKFRFELSNPVQSGHTVGIKLGDISDMDLNPQDFLYSPTYYDRPQIGVLFDIANVE